MLPKISVIIPVYNAEKYLAFCLDSVLGQDIGDLEVICVDDGSTDSSPDILENYCKKDSRIKIIRQVNSFAGVARNNGIAYATGEYIHFLDADDWVAENAYGGWYAVATECKADICICLQARHNLFTGKDRKLRKKSDERVSEFSIEDTKSMLNVSVVPWDKLIRKEFVLKNNLRFSSTCIANDRSFFVASMLKANRIFVVNEYFINHREKLSTSLTESRRYEMFFNHFIAIDEILEITKDTPKSIQGIFMRKEIGNLLDAYVKSKGTPYEKSIRKQLRDFFTSLDLSEAASLLRQDQIDLCYEILESDNTCPIFFTLSAMRIRDRSLEEGKRQKENQKLAKQVSKLEKDARIGRMVNFPFRKMSRLVRCYRQNGLRYTVKRVGVKLDSVWSKIHN